jgi:hypothetical protein
LILQGRKAGVSGQGLVISTRGRRSAIFEQELEMGAGHALWAGSGDDLLN